MLASAAQFHPYSPSHFAAIAAGIIITALAIFIGRRVRSSAPEQASPRERAWRTTLGFITLITWIISLGLWLRPSVFELSESLPLHVCDITGLIVPLAFFTQRRILYTLTYFWALALSLQAFITPVLTHAFPDPLYFNFWSTHIAVVGAAVYFPAVERYRPTLRDFTIAVAVLVAYVAVILPLDVITGWDYGYVAPGDAPPGTVLAVLGPWPGRVFILGALAIGVMAVCWLPWGMAGRLRGSSGDRA